MSIASPPALESQVHPILRASLLARAGQRRSARPTATLLTIMATAVASLMLAPQSAPAFAGIAVTAHSAQPVTTAKAARLGLSGVEMACRGQSWGAESAECLDQIAKESGRPERTGLRVVATRIDGRAPNDF